MSEVSRIHLDPEGVPVIRNTDLRVADIIGESLETSDAEILAAHPGLEADDLSAARTYANEPHGVDKLIDDLLRSGPPEPDAHGTLSLYLNLPRVVLNFEESQHGGSPIKVRSSFEAAFTDVMVASAQNIIWLSAIGCLCFLDEVGSALRRVDRPAADGGLPDIERALCYFTDLAERERAGLYALRCALAHDYSLVNQGRGKRAALLQHAFVLTSDPAQPLVTFPDTPWGGDFLSVTDTTVNLVGLIELARQVRATIMEQHALGNVALALSPAETRRRYIFTHSVSIAEWDSQRAEDQRQRWGT